MVDTSSRLLRLLSLLQSRRFWTGRDLAERLEITERTVRRDVERLRTLGYPVAATSGVAGGYRLGAGAEMPPLLLEDDEALAVAIGLRTAAGGSVSGIEEIAVRAMAKLDQVLPKRLRKRVDALQTAIVPLDHGAPRIDAKVLSSIAGACRDQTRLRFHYADARGQAGERDVEPHGVVHTAYRWYLVAWDVGRDDFRTFRVDRIAPRPALATGARFTPRPLPEKDLATYVSRSVGAKPYKLQARVLLMAPLERMRERLSPMAGHLERVDDATCQLHTGAHSADTLAFWIGTLGVDFEVKDPPELAGHLRALAARLVKAADASTPAARG